MAVKKKGGLKRGLDALFEDNVVPFNLDQEENGGSFMVRISSIEPNRNQILTYLKKYNTKRNQVVHDLFDIADIRGLRKELDDYADLADEIIRLLAAYEDQVCENFCSLASKMKCDCPNAK